MANKSPFMLVVIFAVFASWIVIGSSMMDNQSVEHVYESVQSDAHEKMPGGWTLRKPDNWQRLSMSKWKSEAGEMIAQFLPLRSMVLSPKTMENVADYNQYTAPAYANGLKFRISKLEKVDEVSLWRMGKWRGVEATAQTSGGKIFKSYALVEGAGAPGHCSSSARVFEMRFMFSDKDKVADAEKIFRSLGRFIKSKREK